MPERLVPVEDAVDLPGNVALTVGLGDDVVAAPGAWPSR